MSWADDNVEYIPDLPQAPFGWWYNKGTECIKITEMSSSYIQNAITWLSNKDEQFSTNYIRSKTAEFELELRLRRADKCR